MRSSPASPRARRAASRPDHLFAGRLYREPLLAFVGKRAVIPMEGMGITQQKAWLAQQIAEQRKRAARAAQLDLFADVKNVETTI